jgi:hypothetical protein
MMCFEGHFLIKGFCAKRRLLSLNKGKVSSVGYFILILVFLSFFYEIDATPLGIILLWMVSVKTKSDLLYDLCTHLRWGSKTKKHTYLRLTSINKIKSTRTEVEFITWFVRRWVKLKLIDLHYSELSYILEDLSVHPATRVSSYHWITMLEITCYIYTQDLRNMEISLTFFPSVTGNLNWIPFISTSMTYRFRY